MSACAAEPADRALPSPPPCGAGRDIKYGVQPHFAGPWPNLTSLKRSEFHDIYTHGLADLESPPPQEFSWRTQAPDQIEDGSRNQASCGSCWSFATASVLGDRYALANGIKSPKPSVTFLLSGVGSMGINQQPSQTCCCGGDIQTAAKWLQTNPIKLEECWPYSVVQEQQRSCPAEAGSTGDSTPNYTVPPNLNVSQLKDCCGSCCGNTMAKPEFTVKPGSVKALRAPGSGIDGQDVAKTILAIKQDIHQNGPIATSIMVPPNFQDFWTKLVNNPTTTEVFVPEEGQVGGHAIVLTGWGGPIGNQWWEVRNSWGSPGFMRFQMTKPNTPSNLRTGIDVPIMGGQFGGTVSFLPGPLTSGYNFEKAVNGTITQPGQFFVKTFSLPLVLGIAVVVTLLIAIFIVKLHN